MAVTTRNSRQLVALAFVALLTAGAVYSSAALTGGNGNEPIEPLRIANFERLPHSIGLWHHEQDAVLEQPVIAMVQSAAYSARVYRHQITGRKMTVVALLGPMGPTVAHTPRVCYAATGYQLLSEHLETIKGRSVSETGRQSTFSCSRWGKPEMADRLTVLHAWNTGQDWESPTYPRIAFAGKRWLYSLQIVVGNDGQSDAPADDAELCNGFLAEYLPLSAPLFTASPSPRSTSNLQP